MANDSRNKAIHAAKKDKDSGRKMLFVGKVEHKNGTYHASGNRTKASEAKYTHDSDNKYGASGMGTSHASAVGSLLEGDHRFRHGRDQIRTKNPKFKMK